MCFVVRYPLLYFQNFGLYIGEVHANKYRTQPAKGRRSALQILGSGESQILLDPSERLFLAHIPAIIEPAQFEAAQMQLQQNRRIAKCNNKTNRYITASDGELWELSAFV